MTWPTLTARGKSRHGIRPSLHRARTALRFGHLLTVCSLIARCPAGPGTVSVLAGLSPRTVNSPWQKSSRHSTVPASRRTALRFGHILPVCTRIAPCPAGAGTVSVLAGLSPRTVKHGFAFKGDVLLTPGNFAVGGGFKSENFKYYSGLVPEAFVLAFASAHRRHYPV